MLIVISIVLALIPLVMFLLPFSASVSTESLDRFLSSHTLIRAELTFTRLLKLHAFLRRQLKREFTDDESSPQAELSRRWSASVDGLKSAELERAIGTLAEDDYISIRKQYVTSAASILQAMKLEAEAEQEMLDGMEMEVKGVRYRALGPNGVNPLITCPNCSHGMDEEMDDCPNCGSPLVEVEQVIDLPTPAKE